MYYELDEFQEEVIRQLGISLIALRGDDPISIRELTKQVFRGIKREHPEFREKGKKNKEERKKASKKLKRLLKALLAECMGDGIVLVVEQRPTVTKIVSRSEYYRHQRERQK